MALSWKTDGCGLAERWREGCLGWSVYGEDWHAEGVLDILLEWLSLASDLAAHSLYHHSSSMSHLSAGESKASGGWLVGQAVDSFCNVESLRPTKAR